MNFSKWWFVPYLELNERGDIGSQCKFIQKENRKAKVKAKRVGKVNKNKGKGDQREGIVPFLWNALKLHVIIAIPSKKKMKFATITFLYTNNIGNNFITQSI